MSNAPVEPESTVAPWREVFGWRFWLNYAVSLVLTLWVPLTELKMTVDGVQQGNGHSIPLYRVYRELFRDHATWAVWKTVLLHWGITFVVMALMWWLLLRVVPARRAKRA